MGCKEDGLPPCYVSFWRRGGAGCAKKPAQETGGKLQVAVTFNALRELAAAVGGEKAEIAVMIPDGVEPHDFEPKARDLEQLGKAKVFVYNGLGMESWTEEAVKAVNNQGLIVAEASKGATPISGADEAGTVRGQYDPHLWLSPEGAILETQNIRDAFVQADPANAAYYEGNCNAFVQKLQALHDEYAAKFQAAPEKSFVTGHAAFAYLCREFDLAQNSVEDVYAEGEPSAQQLAKLVQYCKENHVTTVFAEQMASPDVSRTLANEVGAQVQTIYTMESTEDSKSYLERMSDNLAKIYESLVH